MTKPSQVASYHSRLPTERPNVRHVHIYIYTPFFSLFLFVFVDELTSDQNLTNARLHVTRTGPRKSAEDYEELQAGSHALSRRLASSF